MSVFIAEQDLPQELTPDQAVEAAYAAQLAEVASDVQRGLPVVSGYTREYVANVLGGRYRFTDKLVRSCAEQLGIDFGYVGPDDEES